MYNSKISLPTGKVAHFSKAINITIIKIKVSSYLLKFQVINNLSI